MTLLSGIVERGMCPMTCQAIEENPLGKWTHISPNAFLL